MIFHFLFQYESMSISQGDNALRYNLEAFSDISTKNVADLKVRIEEMLRIKVKNYLISKSLILRKYLSLTH